MPPPRVAEMEMVAVTSAHSQGVLSTDQLSELVEAYGDGDLALWVADRASECRWWERGEGERDGRGIQSSHPIRCRT